MNFFGRTEPENIETPSFDPEKGVRENAAVCLETLIQNSLKWYYARLSKKGAWSKFLRLGSLVFASIAGLVAAFLGTKAASEFTFFQEYGISTICIAISGIFVAYDRLYGYTSSWKRYMATICELELQRDAFFQIQEQMISDQEFALECEKIKKKVRSIIAQEVRAWSSETVLPESTKMENHEKS